MSRLDDVLARHAERKKMNSKRTVLIVMTVVVATVVVLELFTDLGTPDAPVRPRVERVNGVLLRTPPPAHHGRGSGP